MLDRRAAWSLPLLLAAVSSACWLLQRARDPVAAPADDASLEAERPAAPRRAGRVRWIIAGGGPTPELNQIQIEQDLALAHETLRGLGGGRLLYAGGVGSESVQVLRREADPDPLRARLGELFDPRAGRDSRYQPATLRPDGVASAEAILGVIEDALAGGGAPLTVYLAGHGTGGSEPHESLFLTWGAHDLDVDALAEVLDRAPAQRPVRLVVTSCHAGGFAELAFARADPDVGAADGERCGFFATTWDRAAAGCDPNPDRGAQEGYGIHFLRALRGQDRHGSDASAAIDLDGDGAISLLEAHARARIASSSLDVPVSTSERFLRAAASGLEPAPEAPLPRDVLLVERAVVRALTERLELERPSDVSARLDDAIGRRGDLSDQLDEIEADLEVARQTLRAELLHRWPTLDDPWHRDFAATFGTHRAAIEAHLSRSPAARRQAELERARAALADTHDALLVATAPMERLERALSTLRLAARLRAEGGPDWSRYRRFLACESGLP